jgi:hypothetical protein
MIDTLRVEIDQKSIQKYIIKIFSDFPQDFPRFLARRAIQ